MAHSAGSGELPPELRGVEGGEEVRYGGLRGLAGEGLSWAKPLQRLLCPGEVHTQNLHAWLSLPCSEKFYVQLFYVTRTALLWSGNSYYKL